MAADDSKFPPKLMTDFDPKLNAVKSTLKSAILSNRRQVKNLPGPPGRMAKALFKSEGYLAMAIATNLVDRPSFHVDHVPSELVKSLSSEPVLSGAKGAILAVSS